MKAEDEFNRIAQGTIDKAARIQCDASEFIEGLKYIQSEIQVAIEAARSDLAHEL